ncbi:MAG TPA: HAD-IA family hydrolase [Verrucomicrobiaceae bacterium]
MRESPTRNQPIRAIFFDAAGTLFSLQEPVGQTYARIGLRHGVKADAAKLETTFRAAWRDLPAPLHPDNQPPADDDRGWWRELVRRTFAAESSGMDPSPSESLFADLYDHFAQAPAWRLHEDIPVNLRRLSGRFRLFVLSNFDCRLRTILAGLKISDCFERVILSSEVGASKPHPRMFQAALAGCGLPAGACLHVGDDPRADVAGAIAAGLWSFQIQRPAVTLDTLLEKIESDDFPACIARNFD